MSQSAFTGSQTASVQLACKLQGYDINKCCYFCDNNLPVGAVIPLITVTENKEFASKSCSTDYLKLEAASRFKNVMMN